MRGNRCAGWLSTSLLEFCPSTKHFALVLQIAMSGLLFSFALALNLMTYRSLFSFFLETHSMAIVYLEESLFTSVKLSVPNFSGCAEERVLNKHYQKAMQKTMIIFLPL